MTLCKPCMQQNLNMFIKSLILLSLFVLSASCSQPELIKYVVSCEGEFEVLYSDNIKDSSVGYWSEERYESHVMIYVKTLSGKNIDVMVICMGRNGTYLYDREIGKGPILIEGRLYDL